MGSYSGELLPPNRAADFFTLLIASLDHFPTFNVRVRVENLTPPKGAHLTLWHLSARPLRLAS